MKNVMKYSVEVQKFGNPIDAREHPKFTILGVFNSKSEAESFILERETPDRYAEDLEGWIRVDGQFTFLYKIKMVPM